MYHLDSLSDSTVFVSTSWSSNHEIKSPVCFACRGSGQSQETRGSARTTQSEPRNVGFHPTSHHLWLKGNSNLPHFCGTSTVPKSTKSPKTHVDSRRWSLGGVRFGMILSNSLAMVFAWILLFGTKPGSSTGGGAGGVWVSFEKSKKSGTQKLKSHVEAQQKSKNRW